MNSNDVNSIINNLIKRSDAIKAIEEHHSFINNQCKYPSEGCIEVIEDAINVPPVDRPQGWIPCSERMPEYRKIVLISTFWGVKTGFLDSTEAYGDFWEIIENDATTALHNIYAWMPLPAPWEGEEDEF